MQVFLLLWSFKKVLTQIWEERGKWVFFCCCCYSPLFHTETTSFKTTFISQSQTANQGLISRNKRLRSSQRSFSKQLQSSPAAQFWKITAIAAQIIVHFFWISQFESSWGDKGQRDPQCTGHTPDVCIFCEGLSLKHWYFLGWSFFWFFRGLCFIKLFLICLKASQSLGVFRHVANLITAERK